ncbi:response regulator [Paenibacillus psychroresistens]|uniref:Response regulator n=1 Tax=Paenibacillus psychroresistens TaxID=1778678 RepID=A0A6B8RKK1_9BACL|nr:response regulator [Paenibacillus psychroresistens]QGQ95946.1 response regulator [Paenibacillus psychroresistens]
MTMKVLILDDETIQRKGIIAKIQTYALPLMIIGEAGDGEEGLQLIKQEMPDIVITDIRMPEMNGLDFIEQALEQNPQIFFIIVSGYSDFEYAKRAMKYGISDYILKPVDEIELHHVLSKVILKIEAMRRNLGVMNKLKQDNELNRESLRKQYLTRMIQTSGNAVFTAEDNTDIQQKYPYFLAIVLELESFKLPHHSFRAGDEHLIWFAVENIMSDQMKQASCEGFIFQHAIHQNEMVYLLGVSHLNENLAIKEWLANVLQGVNRCLKLDVTIALGSFVDQMALMQQSYQLAKLSIRNKMLKGTNQIYDYSLIHAQASSRHNVINDHDERLLFKLLSDGNETALLDWVEQRIKQLVETPSSTYVHLDWFCVDMYLLMRKFLIEKTKDTDLLIGEMDDLQFWVQNLLSWKDAIKQISKQVSQITAFLAKKANYPSKDLMGEIKRYLDSNLHAPISLQLIADRFYINPTYFSRRFKDNYGQSYSEYLTKLRLDKASEWLIGTNLKIQEIAELVGYEGAAYFSNVFKKERGFSPNEFRQKHQMAK